MRKRLAIFGIGFLGIGSFLLVSCGGADVGAAESNTTGVTFDDPAALIQPPPITGTSVGVNAGYAGNGVTLDIPSGFDISQCRFTAALATMDGKAISAQVTVNQNTGLVKCTKVVQEREEVPPETKDCAASFTVLCTK